jgi:hypothetical protein
VILLQLLAQFLLDCCHWANHALATICHYQPIRRCSNSSRRITMSQACDNMPCTSCALQRLLGANPLTQLLPQLPQQIDAWCCYLNKATSSATQTPAQLFQHTPSFSLTVTFATPQQHGQPINPRA